jgi:hypothetical protein
MVLIALTRAFGQDGSAGSGGLGSSLKTGLTREELLRSWDLDGDGSISPSEADLARARMRRQRAEMHLESGIDPVTGLPRGESPTRPEGEPQPRYQLPPEVPTDEPEEPAGLDATGKPKSTRPKPMAELLAPIATKDPVPGLPRMPNLTGKPSDDPASSPPERSGRASWLPPTKSSTTGLGGPRAGAPPAVSGYGSDAWSDLNAGRFRAMPYETQRSPATAGRTPTTGGGLLPTARKPGQTGALILPGTQDPRLAPTTPAVPTAPRIPTFAPQRVTAEDIGGFGP